MSKNLMFGRMKRYCVKLVPVNINIMKVALTKFLQSYQYPVDKSKPWSIYIYCFFSYHTKLHSQVHYRSKMCLKRLMVLVLGSLELHAKLYSYLRIYGC